MGMGAVFAAVFKNRPLRGSCKGQYLGAVLEAINRPLLKTFVGLTGPKLHV